MASSATFVAYIDEAGDEGFKFGKGSSEWFVLGAAILRRASEMPEIRLVDDVRARLNRGRKPDRQFPPRKALHFRDLEHDVRKYYASRIAKAFLKTAVVLIKKRDVLSGSETAAEEKQRRMALYHAATLGLVGVISRHCADEYTPSEPGDGSVDLVFSSRSSLDYAQLKNTIGQVLADPNAFGYGHFMAETAHPSAGIIKAAQVQAIIHSKSMGLQIADAVTSSYFYAVESSADGFVEDAYVRLLLSCAYHHLGELFGHGINAQFCKPSTRLEMEQELTRWKR